MNYRSIAKHLRPYIMLSRRRTTINHAFAAAVAPHDDFDDNRVRGAIELLEQNPDKPLICVYCGQNAETWDHINATVRNSRFSGHGHRLGNLLPCCKQCNSKKTNKDWSLFIKKINPAPDDFDQRSKIINTYIAQYEVIDDISFENDDHMALAEIRRQVLDLLTKGDEIAARIRRSE